MPDAITANKLITNIMRNGNDFFSRKIRIFWKKHVFFGYNDVIVKYVC